MRIARVEDLHCDAGWRNFSFLKIITDDGLVGWSEFTEADGSRGLTGVIHGMAEGLIGQDPRLVQRIWAAARHPGLVMTPPQIHCPIHNLSEMLKPSPYAARVPTTAAMSLAGHCPSPTETIR